MQEVRSFDVFDTVVTRRVGVPQAVIELLARRLEVDGELAVPAPTFVAARLRYERQLTANLQRHATLREIYDAVCDALSLDRSCAERWAEAEERIERELVVPLPGAVEMVDAVRTSSDALVFVSDTPHTERFLSHLLNDLGVARPADRVFTSADRRVSKTAGGLFRAVAEDFGAAHRFIHVGDNRRSDLAAARIEGWSSSLATGGRLSRYEQLLERHAAETDHLASWLAGASRLARLEGQTRGVSTPIAQVAAGVLAPTLVGYALWVLAQARRLGVRRLYYVARDGKVMLEAARHVIGALAPDIELRYLYGSRQPWTLAAGATCEDTLAAWVRGKPDATARTLLARVDLTPQDVLGVVELPVLCSDRVDVSLTESEREQLALRLLDDPLRPLVRGAAERAARQSLAYLRQEGLADGVPSALVDAGWSGTTAAAFDRLVDQVGGASVHHLMLGVLGPESQTHLRETLALTPWLFNQDEQPGLLRELPVANTLIEMLCADVSGRTLSYESRDGRVHPVLAAEVNQPLVDWGVPAMQQVAVRACELVAPRLSQASAHLDLRPAVWAVLRTFWTTPTDAEAHAWGSFPWEEEMWPPFVPVAHRMTASDVIGQAARGRRVIRRRRSWRAGSALVSGEPWRTLLKARAWHERNRHRVARIPRRLRLELAARRPR
ncbi:MAG TPA: HAD family hydrolase [Nocardioidaceae bacterium]|nr:HAD family hydrolase [Nocardioidaceae bacterium]